jgi:hypothetical protein
MTLTELFSYIDTYINTKTGTDRISGAVDNMVRKQTITALIDIISSGFGGDLSSGDNPGTFTKPVYFIATDTGTYNYCDGVEVTKLPAFIFFNGTEWRVKEFDISAEVIGGNINAKGIVTEGTSAPGSPEVGHWYVFAGPGSLNWPGQTIDGPGIVYCTATNPASWNIEKFEKQLGINNITDLADALQTANGAAVTAQETAAGAVSAASAAKTAIDNHKNAESGAHKASAIKMADGSTVEAVISDKVSLTKDEDITGKKTFYKDIVLGSESKESTLVLMNSCQEISSQGGDMYGYVELITEPDQNMLDYIFGLQSDEDWEVIVDGDYCRASFIGENSDISLMDMIYEGTSYKIAPYMFMFGSDGESYGKGVLGTLYDSDMNIVNPSNFTVPGSCHLEVNSISVKTARLRNVPQPEEDGDAVPKNYAVSKAGNERVTGIKGFIENIWMKKAGRSLFNFSAQCDSFRQYTNDTNAKVRAQRLTLSFAYDERLIEAVKEYFVGFIYKDNWIVDFGKTLKSVSYSGVTSSEIIDMNVNEMPYLFILNYADLLVGENSLSLDLQGLFIDEENNPLDLSNLESNTPFPTSWSVNIGTEPKTIKNIPDPVDAGDAVPRKVTDALEQRIIFLESGKAVRSEEICGTSTLSVRINEVITILNQLDSTMNLTFKLEGLIAEDRENKIIINFWTGGSIPNITFIEGTRWKDGNALVLSVNSIYSVLFEYFKTSAGGFWGVGSYKEYPIYQ